MEEKKEPGGSQPVSITTVSKHLADCKAWPCLSANLLSLRCSSLERPDNKGLRGIAS